MKINRLLRSIFLLNVYFCAGIMILDGYGKVCHMHETMCKMAAKNKQTKSDWI